MILTSVVTLTCYCKLAIKLKMKQWGFSEISTHVYCFTTVSQKLDHENEPCDIKKRL